MFGIFRKEERLGTLEVAKRLMQTFSQQETSKFCPRCDKQVLALRPGTSRTRHLLLTIVTLGLWSVGWVIDAIRRPGWRCCECDCQLK